MCFPQGKLEEVQENVASMKKKKKKAAKKVCSKLCHALNGFYTIGQE